MPPIEAVLFDLDGTLLDRRTSLAAFIADQYDRHAVSLGRVSKTVYCDRFLALDDDGRVWKDRVYQLLVDELSISDMTWAELLADYEQAFCRHAQPLPDAEHAVRVLRDRGLKLGVVTNGHSPFQERSLDAIGLGGFFDTVLVSLAEGVRKPDPEVFHRALARLHVDAAYAVFVGDNPVSDIAGARGAGMRTIWIDAADGTACPDADATCRDLHDLPALVETMDTP